MKICCHLIRAYVCSYDWTRARRIDDRRWDRSKNRLHFWFSFSFRPISKVSHRNVIRLKNKLEWQSKQKYKFSPCLEGGEEKKRKGKEENLESNNFYVFLKVFVVTFIFITSHFKAKWNFLLLKGLAKDLPLRFAVSVRKLSNVSS